MMFRAAVTRISFATLLLAPSLALAQGCDKSQEAKNMSCAVGQVWDKEIAACVPITS